MQVQQARTITSTRPPRLSPKRARNGLRQRIGQRGGGRRASGPAWRSTRAGTFSSGWLGLLRLRRSWQLLLAVALGMVVAVVLISTVPLYNTLVTGVELQRELESSGPLARNIEVQLNSDVISAPLHTSLSQQVNALSQQYLHAFVVPTSTSYVQTAETLLSSAGTHTLDLANSTAPEVRFQAFDYAAAAPHMQLVAGAVPAAQSSNGPPQALVTQEMAQAYGLSVGSPITVVAFGAHNVRLLATVCGIWTPRSADDPYWNGLSFAATGSENSPKIYPVQLSESDLFADLGSFGSLGMSQHWIYYTQTTQVTTSSVDAIRSNLGSYRAELDSALGGADHVTTVTVLTQLDQLLGAIAAQQSLLSLPLYMIVAQIVALALLFVATMAGLLVAGQSQDIATLKSRGASGLQILSVYAIQGALLGVVALMLGPILAGQLALALIREFIPSSVLAQVGSGYLAGLVAPQTALLPALAGVLLGTATVTAAALQAARLEVLAFRREQARPSRQPFWRRYYLDVVLAALCLAAYLDLDQFGTTSVRLQLGGGSSPLLLMAPALLLFAGALLVLRVIPLGAALGARLAAHGRGFIPMLALAQVERTPTRYTRITLLLVLAVGLGLFAVTFDSSLAQNAHDRAAYDTGADVRLQMHGPEGSAQDGKIGQKLAALPGVQAVARVYRSTARVSADKGGLAADLLGVDPTTFPEVVATTSWRADYASVPLATVMHDLTANQRAETPGVATHPIYALVSTTFADQNALRVGDRFSLQLNETGFGDTYFVVGRIVQEFPTLYPTHSPGGFVVAGLADYLGAIRANPASDSTQVGPNEYWLKTTSDPAQHAALLQALGDAELDVNTVHSLAEAVAANASNPLGAGIRGLLVVGAITAALLAVLGTVIQSLLAARQRATQFAILRTLGTARTQLTGLLLAEQSVVYLFGLLGGTALGLLLTTATLPFLQFSDTLIDASRIGVPPYLLVFNPQGMLEFYAALLVAFALALLVAARYAATIGLGQALRLGED